ncbi:hypothetical protein GB931_21615 [Modestobacter sp. I12A-02628]|uniref:Uncharacterized protein n=1 Tax=Goekera deserti TaxID=2497753 RepID=A0A7K3W949_9ACTN|nr:hypothetical protein [Goekera deserti]MPR00473.1 hypothetical protein [Goekera deserti]NDI49129.1 hypothetical protein [Goekera deserti]NEL52867.1 hypothetical protein [Goekera deserti]
MRDTAEQQRQTRLLVSVVAASALVYPMLFCAVRLVVSQFLRPDTVATLAWGVLGLACSVGVVAVVRWGARRRPLSPWLLVGLVPPGLFELYLYWPYLTG